MLYQWKQIKTLEYYKLDESSKKGLFLRQLNTYTTYEFDSKAYCAFNELGYAI